MHVAQAGQGPVVLFLHGFPECWYTWRHQMCFLASQGYRAVAPDLRGYGETTGAPNDDPSKFTSLHVVGDLVALISAVAAEDEEKVFVVGHDWGAMMAWALCLYRPDKVKALVNMSVCFTPRNPKAKPLQTLRAVYGDDYYICRFQKNSVNTQINKKLHSIGRKSEWACGALSCCQCRFDIWHWLLCKYKEIKLRFLFDWQEGGEIEGEFAVLGTKKVLQCFLTYDSPSPLYLPKGKLFEGSTHDLPSWLSENDVDYYTSKFEKTGFSGGLNYYRALDLNWELSAAWSGAKVMVPVKFIVGDLDITYNAPGAKEYIHKGGLKRDVPLLEEVVVLEGVGHFTHEEKPHEINTHILNFLHNFSS
nr:bifunctional epoxide hydrolase 2-like isoform X1 [Ipomoea batatas]